MIVLTSNLFSDWLWLFSLLGSIQEKFLILLLKGITIIYFEFNLQWICLSQKSYTETHRSQIQHGKRETVSKVRKSDSRQAILWLGKRAVLSSVLVSSLSLPLSLSLYLLLPSRLFFTLRLWRFLQTTLDRFPSLSLFHFYSFLLHCQFNNC